MSSDEEAQQSQPVGPNKQQAPVSEPAVFIPNPTRNVPPVANDGPVKEEEPIVAICFDAKG